MRLTVIKRKSRFETEKSFRKRVFKTDLQNAFTCNGHDSADRRLIDIYVYLSWCNAVLVLFHSCKHSHLLGSNTDVMFRFEKKYIFL